MVSWLDFPLVVNPLSDLGRFALHHSDFGGHWGLRIHGGGLPRLERLLVLRALLSDAQRKGGRRYLWERLRKHDGFINHHCSWENS